VTDLFANWPTLLRAVAIVLCAVIGGMLIGKILFRAIRRVTAKTSTVLDDVVIRHVGRPLKLILPLLAVIAVLPTLFLPDDTEGNLRHFLGLCLIAAFAWLGIAAVAVVEQFVASRYSMQAADNLTARRILTQTTVLRRILVVLICLVAISVALMSFPGIRQVGASLLASAGLAGLVIGLAARPVIANLLAGIQLALSGPMRLDDVVIVEGEWGRIEEITTTYVVVRIWDLRRLVVPLSYFIEKPFQNWTRSSSELLGTVFLYVDYSVPVDDVRAELRRVLENSGMWDGRVWALQVTNASDRTVELRAQMSAPHTPKAVELRCHVREAQIGYLQQRYPASLPKIRTEVSGLPLDAAREVRGAEA
jgi:small-conductance mechanosensitive channel